MNDKTSKTVMAGYLCAIGATVFWSGNFIVARDLNDSVAPVSLAYLSITAILMANYEKKRLVNE